jgi:hypothetical protein
MHQSVHIFTHSLNKDMLTTYYISKRHMLGTTHLRPSPSISLVYIPTFYITGRIYKSVGPLRVIYYICDRN